MRPTESNPAAPFGLSLSALVALVMAVLLVVAITVPFGLGWEVFYLAFVGATALMVRKAPAAPGSLLRLRTPRRALVGLIALIAAVMTLATQSGPAPYAIIPGSLVALGLLDVALGRATRRVAAAADSAVDEREEQIRNRVHRESFWILALVLGGVLLTNCASFATRRWIWDAFHGGLPLALAQLVFFLPAMTLAWHEPDIVAPESAGRRRSWRTTAAAAMMGVALVVPLLLSATIVLVPVRAKATSSADPSSKPGEHCVIIQARTTVGWGMGAVIPLDGLACADGTRAYESYGFNQSDCHLVTTDFAVATTTRCSRETGPDGTMRFTYAVRVESGLVPFLSRDVTVRTAVDRSGVVRELP
jgi:hypothetical protein